MLNVGVGSDKEIRLSGSIEGGGDLAGIAAKLQPALVLECSGVLRINSVGTKAWIKYFGEPSTQAAQVAFKNLSPALVEQLNMYRNFLGGAKILSIALPFRCETCNLNFTPVVPFEELAKFKGGGVNVPCTQCKGPADFDDIPEEYLAFLDRE